MSQCPLLFPSVHSPQMVWECVCVCMRVCVYTMNLKYAIHWHIHISVLFTLCQHYTQAQTHPQTIWGQQTNRAKSGYCPTQTLEELCALRTCPAVGTHGCRNVTVILAMPPQLLSQILSSKAWGRYRVQLCVFHIQPGMMPFRFLPSTVSSYSESTDERLPFV